MKILIFFLLPAFSFLFSSAEAQKTYNFMKSPNYTMTYNYSSSKIQFTLEFQTNGYVGLGFGSKKMIKENNASCHTMYYKNQKAYLLNGFCENGKFTPLANDDSAVLLDASNKTIEQLVNTTTFFPNMRKFVFERTLKPTNTSLYQINITGDVPMVWFTGRNDDFREEPYFDDGLDFNFVTGLNTFGQRAAFWVVLVLACLSMLF